MQAVRICCCNSWPDTLLQFMARHKYTASPGRSSRPAEKQLTKRLQSRGYTSFPQGFGLSKFCNSDTGEGLLKQGYKKIGMGWYVYNITWERGQVLQTDDDIGLCWQTSYYIQYSKRPNDHGSSNIATHLSGWQVDLGLKRDRGYSCNKKCNLGVLRQIHTFWQPVKPKGNP